MKTKSNMKRTLFVAALALISVGAFAQADNVKLAKKLTSKKDFAGARAAIHQALENEETKNQALTWYQAGEIGYRQLKAETEKIYEDPMYQVDYATAGQAVYESCEYFIVADSLAMIPTLDKKGREVVDLKTRKNIQQKMLQYYLNRDLVNYGAAMQGKSDWRSAYKAFRMHTMIPNLPMMQDPKLQQQMPKDTVYQEYMYYAVNFAYSAEMYPEMIEMIQEMLQIENVYKANQITKWLHEAYHLTNDSAGMEATLKLGVERYPDDMWFLQSMINYYVYSNQQQKAIDYLNEAIERDPNSTQYYVVKGNLLESQNRYTQAQEIYEKVLEMDPNNARAYAGLGFIKYNQAQIFDNSISSNLTGKALDQAEQTRNAMYHAAIPYFEKAVELGIEDTNMLTCLRGLYFRFRKEPGMMAKYEKLAQHIKDLQNK